MKKSVLESELTEFFEDSFRALKPENLSQSILELCNEACAELNEEKIAG